MMPSETSELDLERRRRMAECWLRHAPSDFETRLARQRFVARGSGARDMARVAALLGVALAACVLAVRPGAAEEEPALHALGVPQIAQIQDTLVAAELPSAGKQPASLARTASLVAPPTVKRGPRPVRQVAVRRATPRQQHARLVVKERIVITFSDAADRDFRPDPLTRDVALLSRAYLWVSDGREDEARELLEQLADRGATRGIRRRASELLLRTAEARPLTSTPAEARALS
jgi:hypothetical protein